ncbi:MAG: PorT family protein [Dysgonamonadaceae bacterium]|nr:PorT family protein [Dysgonamonadaceae bacterium]
MWFTQEQIANFHAGLMCQINLSQNRFFLQPELLFSLQGDKGKRENEEGENESFADDLCYLQLPVHLIYKITVAPEGDILLGAGAYAAYGVYGSKKTFDGGYYSRLDYGFSFMGGFQFGRIQLTGAYDLGMNEIIDTKKWNETQDMDGVPVPCTRNLKISLGYFF